MRGVSSPVYGCGKAMSAKRKQPLSGWVHVFGVTAAVFAVSVAIVKFRIITRVLKRTSERNAVSMLERSGW